MRLTEDVPGLAVWSKGFTTKSDASRERAFRLNGKAPVAEIRLERNSGKFARGLGERKFADKGSHRQDGVCGPHELCPSVCRPFEINRTGT